MAGFSKDIIEFLKNIIKQTPQEENFSDILQLVGKSLSSFSSGDILIFHYVESLSSKNKKKRLGDIIGFRPQRAILVVNAPVPLFIQRSRYGNHYIRKINYGGKLGSYLSKNADILIPCVDLDLNIGYSLDNIRELYKNRGLIPSENYKSYRWDSMYQIYKVKI